MNNMNFLWWLCLLAIAFKWAKIGDIDWFQIVVLYLGGAVLDWHNYKRSHTK